MLEGIERERENDRATEKSVLLQSRKLVTLRTGGPLTVRLGESFLKKARA